MKKNYTTPAERKCQQLQHLLPEAFTEGKINWQKLKTILQPHLAPDETRERYGLGWVGKQEAYRQLQDPPTQTLEPCKESSHHFDTSKNIFIEGENLETLKILEKSYYRRIKMIYIDPPYNTGGDFVYNDRFQQTKKSYQQSNGELNGNGDKNYEDHLNKNTRENGHYHSNWLSMIYPRLFLARNLLRDDGVIFVSIDDHEVHNLRLVMDELFGEENFVAGFVWRKRKTQANLTKYITSVHEHILFYAKKIEDCVIQRLELNKEYIKKTYKNPDNDKRGLWRLAPLASPESSPNKNFGLKLPDGRILNKKWRCSQHTFDRYLKENLIVMVKNGMPNKKIFFSENKGYIPNTWLDTIGTTESASTVIKKILGSNGIFPFPKPKELVQHFCKISTKKTDLILDFFAGSGTTAQAVMELNAEDGGKRRYICVQLPEKCDETREAFQAGYSTIAAIARERIRRASKKIAHEHPDYKGDLGFKAFKQVPSHFIPWEGNVESPEALLAQLKKHQQTSLLPATKPFALLYELLLDKGYPLHSTITYHKQEQGNLYQVTHPERDDPLLFLLERVDEHTLALLLQWKPKPLGVFILDDAFQRNDCLKTNISLQLRDADIRFESF